jgi:AraC-like DNA-binding protein
MLLRPARHDSGADVGIALHGVVRVGSLFAAPALLRERGLDPSTVLAGLGLDPCTFDDPDNRIHYRLAGRVVERCVDATDCPHFGLLLGQHATILSLGSLGELMLCAPTVQVALRDLELHMDAQTRGGVVTHEVEGDTATLGYGVYLPDMPAQAQICDLALAYACNVLRALCGSAWVPSEVMFLHARPRDTSPYRQFFNGPLRFDAGRSAIVFRKSWLERALPGHDAGRHRALQLALVTQSMPADADLTESVRRALRTMVPRGRGSEAAVAALLSMPVRTLRRQLAAQGATFRDLTGEVRYEIARQLLIDSSMTVTDIAEVLGYSNASAFTRSFRRWTNTPPAAWRARLRSRAASPLGRALTT